MQEYRRPSLLEVVRATPVTSLLLSVVPVVLAVGQLINGYQHGISPVVSGGFAVVLGCFAVVATGHHVAAYRLACLESLA